MARIDKAAHMYLQTALSRGVATFSKSRSLSIWFVYVRSSLVSLKINENSRAIAQSYHYNGKKITILFMNFGFRIMLFETGRDGPAICKFERYLFPPPIPPPTIPAFHNQVLLLAEN